MRRCFIINFNSFIKPFFRRFDTFPAHRTGRFILLKPVLDTLLVIDMMTLFEDYDFAEFGEVIYTNRTRFLLISHIGLMA